MGNRNSARFLGIVGEISLCIHVGVVADDFDGSFIGADGPVRTKTPEFTGRGAGRSGVDVFTDCQGCVREVVFNADGEAVFWFSLLEVVKD